LPALNTLHRPEACNAPPCTNGVDNTSGGGAGGVVGAVAAFTNMAALPSIKNPIICANLVFIFYLHDLTNKKRILSCCFCIKKLVIIMPRQNDRFPCSCITKL
jgi:hypothetical protein